MSGNDPLDALMGGAISTTPAPALPTATPPVNVASLVREWQRLNLATRQQGDAYINVGVGNPYRNPPARYFSDFGFLVGLPFDYATPDAALVEEHDERREIRRVILIPYGHEVDLATFSSVRREIHPRPGAGRRGVYREGNYVYAADSTARHSRQLELLQSPRGRAFHVLLARNGWVVVAAPLDDDVDGAEGVDDALYVGIEVALEMEYERYRTSRRPFSANVRGWETYQLFNLVTLLGKLKAVFPALPLEIVEDDGTTPGVIYRTRPLFDLGIGDQNLLPDAPNPRVSESTFQQALRGVPAFAASTEVFRPPPPTPTVPATGPVEVIAPTSPATPNTAGSRVAIVPALTSAQSVADQNIIMQQYADLASRERANDMAASSRLMVFTRRARQASSNAAGHAAQAATTTQHAAVLNSPLPEVSDTDPLTYNYETGFWGDNSPF